MKKIKIHRFDNELWGRAHLPFFRQFDKFLSTRFEIEVKNYNVDGNTFSGQIETISKVSNFDNKPVLSDVDYLIENLHTGELKLISFTEYFNSYASHYAKSDACSKVLLAHFNSTYLYYWMKRENSVKNMYKVSPWLFFPFQEYDVNFFRNKRYSLENLDDRLFWQGSGVDSYRLVIKLLNDEEYFQPIAPSDNSTYLDRLSRSKIALSYYMDLDKYTTPFDHPGEFCYRDNEYLSLGVPYIRIEYKDNLYDPLLPNFHYVCIPREEAFLAYSKDGNLGVKTLIEKKYREVYKDEEFLKFISHNQIEWYTKNFENRFMLTYKLLNLEDWQ